MHRALGGGKAMRTAGEVEAQVARLAACGGGRWGWGAGTGRVGLAGGLLEASDEERSVEEYVEVLVVAHHPHHCTSPTHAC